MKFGDWINRKRHNRGFGIQSPSSFFFITQVLKERLPYYAYPLLDKVIDGGATKRRHFRELFRITNYQQPESCISIGSAEAACAMVLAKPFAKHYAIAPTGLTSEKQALLNERGCQIIESIDQFKALMAETSVFGMFYIDATDNADTFIKAAMSHTNNRSLIFVDGISRSQATRQWWQQIVNDSTITVTYDMYSYGLLFFDKERRKQNYTLKK